MRIAPDTPPIEVKYEITHATSGGSHNVVSTPETGKKTSIIVPLYHMGMD
jgi:hypothetical protein